MVFKCQQDSFLTEFDSKIVSIEKIKDSSNEYNIILEDTILFPEGGGQPCDHGYLNDKPVINVIRKGSEAVHIVQYDDQESLNVGDIVKQKVNWERRFDHMQQHSGQHLITAIFEREYGIDTKSWWLGTEDSYIELDTNNITIEQIENVEKIVNQLIANKVPVTVHVVEEGESSVPPEVTRATKGLPKDHVGAIRVITIEGIESNMCCGTHVKNLSQLQVIKLLKMEKSKKKLLLHFLVGQRVIDKLAECYERELQLNLLLNGGPLQHIDLVKKLKDNIKINQRKVDNLYKEIALNEANKFNALTEKPIYYFLHRQDIAPYFTQTFFKNLLESNKTFFFLTFDDGTGKGMMVLQGVNTEQINHLGATLSGILDGKGKAIQLQYQANVNNLRKINECEKTIIEYLSK